MQNPLDICENTAYNEKQIYEGKRDEWQSIRRGKPKRAAVAGNAVRKRRRRTARSGRPKCCPTGGRTLQDAGRKTGKMHLRAGGGRVGSDVSGA